MARETARSLSLGSHVLLALCAMALAGAVGSGCSTAPEAESNPAATSESADEPVEVTDRMESSEAADDPAGEKDTGASNESDTSTDPLPSDAPVITATSGTGIEATAPEGLLGTSAFEELDAAVADFVARGNTMAFMLVDLETGWELSYNDDALLYPASAVKAAYCAMIYETNGGAGGLYSTVESCLLYSDNTAYDTLFAAYGYAGFGSWLTEHGATQAGKKGSWHRYPEFTARELALVWQEIYRYGTSGEAGATELTGLLARTEHTPLGETLRDTCEVWSKAG